MITADVLSEFSQILDKDSLILDPAVITSYCQEPRGLYGGKSSLVLRPKTTRDVAKIMQVASRYHLPIVPQGGNTGLVGGQQPDSSYDGIILSLEKLNKIRKIDEAGSYILVESGAVLKDIQEAADKIERLFPLTLASQMSCQIGGNLSTNAGGVSVLSYGNTRDLCLGLEVVLPDGRILDDLRYVKKDNSGYDLKNLFIGAEGTLGIITAAVMKLFPKPKGRATAFIGLKDLDCVLTFFKKAQENLGFSLVAIELLSEKAMQIALSYAGLSSGPIRDSYPYYILVESVSFLSHEAALSQLENALKYCMENDIIADATLATNLTQAALFWRLRENMSAAQKLLGPSVKNDISIPLARLNAFMNEAQKAVHEILQNAVIVAFGHVGDGNIHYNISLPLEMGKQDFLKYTEALNNKIYEIVMHHQGSFSAEHGIGQLKRVQMIKYKPPINLEIMKALKNYFDPLNIMNPHKIL